MSGALLLAVAGCTSAEGSSGASPVTETPSIVLPRTTGPVKPAADCAHSTEQLPAEAQADGVALSATTDPTRTSLLLKNIGGLWLLQACIRRWAEAGQQFTYDDLLAAAKDDGYAFRSIFDPDHSAFFHPVDMPGAIAAYCRQTGQPEPAGQPAFTRSILESLAFKYRAVLESLEELTGHRCRTIRIVGGGSRNRLLNQLTADATGKTVVAGPVEATALGNIAMQMLATGTVSSLAEARTIIERSFPLERFEPVATDRWHAHYQRFQQYVEVMGV